MLAGNMGGGCIICKVPDETSERGWRWSGPSSLGIGGLGGGFVFGGEKVSYYHFSCHEHVHLCITIQFDAKIMVISL